MSLIDELQVLLDNWRDDDWAENEDFQRSDHVEDKYNLLYTIVREYQLGEAS